ncbi:depupylase/deamidase Dop [Pseudactinotalea sp. Z1739]|uniref:depupylase/deamidase Dop n=1 Tax=Pseudactinotalea sp. Z1739 TaxID=3413028 RepID=UPI003C79FB15
MSVRRIVGMETEFGIMGDSPGLNPMLMSAQVVTAYARHALPEGTSPRWDYSDEDPLNDARGWRLERGAAHPSQLTDTPGSEASGAASAAHLPDIREQRRGAPEPDHGLVANAVLTNGARFYVDHAHPEYSGPETIGPLAALTWDRAGDEIALRASRLLAQIPGMPTVTLYKNNTDGKGASYGTHENYLVDRRVPFGDIVDYLTPFLVTRQIFCGAGRVGLGQHGENPGYQISQRADFIEAEVGLETTLRRPIINTRDEPHADPRDYRRLHVIIGDANLVQVSNYLKLGTTALLLWLLETGQVPLELSALRLADPVAAVRTISRDLTLGEKVDLEDGRSMTAVQIQQIYADVIGAALHERGRVDEQTRDVLLRWREVLSRLATDPAQCAREVEWVAKLRLLEGMRARRGTDWDDHRLAAMDLQWSDLRPEKGVYARLAAAGGVEILVDDQQVEHAIANPPSDTRAYFRGETLRRYGPQVEAANWDAVVFDLPGRAHLTRVPTSDPYRGSAEHVGDLLAAHPRAEDLIAALGNP